MQITERIYIIIIAVITAISAFFCIISFTTPRWSHHFGLFCTGCHKPPAGLSIVAFLLLLVSIAILIALALKFLSKSFRILSLLVLFIATIFTLAAYTSYFDNGTGYSFKLMVVAHFFCYIATLLSAFWLGGSYAPTVVAPNNS